jgi:hypothetical protein
MASKNNFTSCRRRIATLETDCSVVKDPLVPFFLYMPPQEKQIAQLFSL